MEWLPGFFAKTILSAGVKLISRAGINFTGGVQAVDNPATGNTDVSIGALGSTLSLTGTPFATIQNSAASQALLILSGAGVDGTTKGGGVAIGLNGYDVDGTTSAFELLGDVGASKAIFAAGAFKNIPFLSGANFSPVGDAGLQLQRIGGVQLAWHTASYAANYAPEPYLWSRYAMTLSGDVDLGAPGAYYSQQGQEITIQVTQDGSGGHTTTWHAVYVFPTSGPGTGSTPVATPNYVTQWTFACQTVGVGDVWRCVSRNAYPA